MGGEISQQLLTNDDQRMHLQKILGHRLKSVQRLQLPSLEQYNKLDSDEGLKSLAYEICQYIGFKPSGLQVNFADNPLGSAYTVNHDSKSIIIDPQFIKHPYSIGAALAMGVVAYVIEQLGHEEPSPSFVELATIETGLGLWIINSLRPRLSWRQKIYHSLDTNWFHKDGVQLQSFSPKLYVERVVSYAHENHIAVDTYLPHVLERVRYLFPNFILKQTNHYLPEATVVVAHKRSASLLWLKVVLVSLIVTSGITLGIYVIFSRPNPTNPETIRLQKSITDLKKAYERCNDEATVQQNSYDPNDLFLTRQIDDTKAHCESLRNQYNYTIDQYEAFTKK